MSLNARNATAKDFEAAAQSHANASWFYGILSVIIFNFLGFWGLIPLALTIISIIKSTSSTKMAMDLRNGTYKIPNPNNGIDDSE